MNLNSLELLPKASFLRNCVFTIFAFTVLCVKFTFGQSWLTVAFCCISTGEFRFPRVRAAEIAVEEVRNFLADNGEMRVIFDVFGDDDLSVYREILGRA